MTKRPPFEIHESHNVIELGGFYACTKCGTCSARKAKDNRLPKECQKEMPKGSISRITRIVKGQHPRSVAEKWPSGETNPVPKRVRRSEGSSSRVDVSQ